MEARRAVCASGSVQFQAFVNLSKKSSVYYFPLFFVWRSPVLDAVLPLFFCKRMRCSKDERHFSQDAVNRLRKYTALQTNNPGNKKVC